jgi:hypothetical protein
MKRLVWMGIGVAIGVIAFRKVTEAQASLQSTLGPQGLNRAVGRLADGVYDFADAPRRPRGGVRRTGPPLTGGRPDPRAGCTIR